MKKISGGGKVQGKLKARGGKGGKIYFGYSAKPGVAARWGWVWGGGGCGPKKQTRRGEGPGDIGKSPKKRIGQKKRLQKNGGRQNLIPARGPEVKRNRQKPCLKTQKAETKSFGGRNNKRNQREGAATTWQQKKTHGRRHTGIKRKHKCLKDSGKK